MSVDLKETETAFVFKANVPGLKKEEVALKVEDGKILHVRWQKNEERDEAADGPTRRWIHRERMLGKYNRKFELPEVFDADAVRAKMEDGVLTVVMPKQPRTGELTKMSIDLKETKTTFEFRADMPRLKKEEVTLKVEDGKILHVRWEKNEDRGKAADGPMRWCFDCCHA